MDFEKYYNKALKLLSYRPRSEKEVSDSLKKKKASDSTIQLIIKKLKDQKFLDDLEFSKWWIEQRTVVRPTGLRLIKIELQRKGIDKEMIDNLLQNSEYLILNELEEAKKLAEKRLRTYKNLPREKIYNRLGSFLGRRGFDYDTIKKSIDEVLRQ